MPNSVIKPACLLFVSWISFGFFSKKYFFIQNPYLASFAKTFFPLIQEDKVFLINDLKNLPPYLLITQSSINLILLFLLFLGLRNRFKIK